MLYRALFVYKICRILQKILVAIKLNKFKILDRIKWLVSLGRVSGSTIWLVFHCRRWIWILYHLVSLAHAREPISESQKMFFQKKKISLFLFSKLYKIYSNFHLMRQIHFISRLISSQFDVFTLKFKFVFPLKYIILHLNIYILYVICIRMIFINLEL